MGGAGGKENIPELRGWGGEFDGDEGAFGVEDRRTNDVSLDLFLGLGIFDRNFCAGGQAFGKNDHGAVGADGVCEAVHGIGFAGQVNQHGHPEEHALRTAAFFSRLRASSVCSAFHLASSGRSGRQAGFLRRRHSSSPQKSISGATSSTPYSQPSGC